MATRLLLILGLVLLLVAWLPSGTGVLKRAPMLVRYLIAAIFIFGAVRVGLSIAIIAFDLSPASYLIPIAFGLLAYRFRPGRQAA